ncbi:MAG: hypothetical protein LBV38_00860 [Alistipes sp.]|jgi:hypothetical protein|nr:hypothetical protein [Alistipes sp.]
MKKTVCKKCGSTDVTVTVTVSPNDITPISDYCHQDGAISEGGWCNKCVDYVDLEAIDEGESAAPWHCEVCGSLNIKQRVWADPNTGEVIDMD